MGRQRDGLTGAACPYLDRAAAGATAGGGRPGRSRSRAYHRARQPVGTGLQSCSLQSMSQGVSWWSPMAAAIMRRCLWARLP